MSEHNQCCVKVYGRHASWSGSLCRKPAKVGADGKWYCSTHSPDAAQKRKEKSQAGCQKWHAEQDFQSTRDKMRRDIAEAAVAAVEQRGPWQDVENLAEQLSALLRQATP